MPDFEQAVAAVLAHEGGYNNIPGDRGGETKYGISKKAFPDEDIKSLTVERAKMLYRVRYWVPAKCDQFVSQRVASKVFDLAVNTGVGRAGQLLQEAYNNLAYGNGPLLKVDGGIGPRTLAAVNSERDQDALFASLCFEQANHYVKCNQPSFIRGWLKRAFS